MAIRIELWTEGDLAGGLEAWWDRMELALPEDRATKYPLLSRIDPYSDVEFQREELEPLAGELRMFLDNSPESLVSLLVSLIRLCHEGAAARDARLQFIGD